MYSATLVYWRLMLPAVRVESYGLYCQSYQFDQVLWSHAAHALYSIVIHTEIIYEYLAA